MKIVYVDMDNVLVNFQSGIDALTEEERTAFKNDLDDVPGIFSKMKPVDGAIEAYEKLTQHYDVYILSTAPWKNPSAWSDKLLWVKEHLGKVAYKRLILSHNKNLNSGDYLIDDRVANGAGEWGEKLLRFGFDKNGKPFDYPNWDSIIEFFKSVN